MERYRIPPGSNVDLAKRDPGDRGGFRGGKTAAEAKLALLQGRLAELQTVLYAQHAHKVLVVLQAMDTGGKDGTIRHVFQGVNPQGVRVANFKVPTPLEQDHDFLWRIHQQTPGRGEIVVFNRSHYEDVLVVRVHGLVPEKVWRRRYETINDFEKGLVDQGTTILKFFLHISKDEQKKRLEERRDDSRKQWKFAVGDLGERKLWGEYMKAYGDAINATSTGHAPWHVVPADHKWFRNLVVASVLVQTLESLDMSYPKAAKGLRKLRVD